MPKLKLGRRTLAAIEPSRDRRAVYYDEELTGFAVRVEPTGRVTYFIEYRPGAGGRNVLKKRLTLGTTSQLTPEQARRRAKEMIASIRLGADPSTAAKAERAVPTTRQFAQRYLDEEAAVKLKPATTRNYRSYVKKHINPALGTTKLDKLRAEDVAHLHREIGKRSPAVANRVVECLASIFRYAAICGFVPKGHNPSASITAFREAPRERFLSESELTRLGEVLTLAETEGLPWKQSVSEHVPRTHQRTIIDRHAIGAIRLLAFTGLRLREILHLRWVDVDFERGIALLANTKTGRRYTILNSAALQVLDRLNRSGEYVIRGTNPTKPRSDLNRPWRAVRAAAQLESVRIHDLRHTNAAVAAALGIPLAFIGKMLGHAQPSTTNRYAHLSDDPLRRAANRVGNDIAAVLTPIPTLVSDVEGPGRDSAN